MDSEQIINSERTSAFLVDEAFYDFQSFQTESNEISSSFKDFSFYHAPNNFSTIPIEFDMLTFNLRFSWMIVLLIVLGLSLLMFGTILGNLLVILAILTEKHLRVCFLPSMSIISWNQNNF